MTPAHGLLAGSYNYTLVALSVVIAVVASYAALDLAGRVTASEGIARTTWLTGGAAAMGIGIWSMHYVGMLAFRLPVLVLYDWPTVLLSLLAAILASAVALFVVSQKRMGLARLIAGSFAMGSGIASMHYVGMAAMRLPAMCGYSLPLVVFSVVIAISVSWVALTLAFQMRGDQSTVGGWQKTASALVMGMAIPLMHYTGMAAVTFSPSSESGDLSHAVNVSSLGAAGITTVTFMVLGLAMATAILDRRFSAKAQELEWSEHRFRRLVESNIIGVLVAGREGRILEANDAFLGMLGYTKSDLDAGSIRWDQLTPPEYQEAVRAIGKQLVECGVSAPAEIEHIRKDGKRLPVLVGLASLQENGEQAIGFLLDLTERKRAQRAAEAANRAKSEFLANMSHEIRTPMNGILGMLEMVLGSELNDEQRDCLTIAQGSAEALLHILNDILDFSKIEAGQLDLTSSDFDLCAMVEGAMKTLAVRAHEKGLDLNCEFDAGVPQRITGDPARVRQVILNLIGNAIKFTDRGEVALSVKTDLESEDAPLLQFTVRNTGIGIPPDRQKAIFEAFQQADSSVTRRFGGTGLGLTISSRLVKLMGGRIWVESKEGQGSEFHFTMRLQAAPAQLEGHEPATQASLRDLPALIVDDNATNRRILGDTLRRRGIRPFFAAGGQEALDILEKTAREGQPIPLLITDVHMPGMDGFGLIARIRQMPAFADIRILVLTSGARLDEAARCRELGVTTSLTKPVARAELLDALLFVLGSRPNPAEGAPRPEGAQIQEEQRRPRVLVAEDHLANQKLAALLLRRHGYEPVVVNNGYEALEALTAGEFDAVLMDEQMPGMSGIEASAAIREREKTSGGHMPIIAVTANAMMGDREKYLAAGMDAYISKPIRVKELIEVLGSLVQSHGD